MKDEATTNGNRPSGREFGSHLTYTIKSKLNCLKRERVMRSIAVFIALAVLWVANPAMAGVYGELVDSATGEALSYIPANTPER